MVEPKDLWREAVQAIQSQGGPRDAALKQVICEWLLKGEIEPLIKSRTELDYDLILSVIVLMLLRDPRLDYHLELVPNRIGAPRKAGGLWRDILMARAYQQRLAALGNSDAAFREVADIFGVSDAIVRTALTKYRSLSQRIDPPTTNKS